MRTRLVQYRRARQITQEELARAVKVTRQTIISIENGRYTASLPLAFRLARYFGASIEDLFIFEEEA